VPKRLFFNVIQKSNILPPLYQIQSLEMNTTQYNFSKMVIKQVFFKKNRSWDIWEAGLLLLFLLGLIGNILTMIVFRNKSLRKTNESIVITSLSINDICFLFFKLLANMQKLYNIPIYSSCLLLQHILPQIFAWMTPWLIVMTTIERSFAVIMPLQVSSIFTEKLCFLTICCLSLGFILLSSTQAICLELSVEFPYYCKIKGQYGGKCFNFINIVFSWFKSALMSWIPCLIVIMLNIFIAIYLQKASKKRKIYTNSFICQTIAHPLKDFKKNAVNFRLILISIIFVLLTLPYSTFDLLRKLGFNIKFLRNRNAQRFVMFLLDCLHATNFLVYCVVCQKFRKHLNQIFFNSKGKKSVNVRSDTLINESRSTRSIIML
jgi:hypothetical protein